MIDIIVLLVLIFLLVCFFPDLDDNDYANHDLYCDHPGTTSWHELLRRQRNK